MQPRPSQKRWRGSQVCKDWSWEEPPPTSDQLRIAVLEKDQAEEPPSTSDQLRIAALEKVQAEMKAEIEAMIVKQHSALEDVKAMVMQLHSELLCHGVQPPPSSAPLGAPPPTNSAPPPPGGPPPSCCSWHGRGNCKDAKEYSSDEAANLNAWFIHLQDTLGYNANDTSALNDRLWPWFVEHSHDLKVTACLYIYVYIYMQIYISISVYIYIIATYISIHISMYISIYF